MDLNEKLNNIIGLNNALAAYKGYINNNGNNNEQEIDMLMGNHDFMQYAKVAMIALNLVFRKEEAIENKGQLKYESKLIDGCLEEFIQGISTKVKDGYKIGNYICESPATLVSEIRNKLAHGDFTIDIENNNIRLNKIDCAIEIDIDKLSAFTISLTTLLDSLSKNKIDSRYFLESKVEHFKNGKNIENEKDFIEYLNYVYIHRFYIAPMNNKEFNEYLVQFIEMSYQGIKNCLQKKKDFKTLKNTFADILYKNGFILNYNKIKATKLENIDKLLSFYSKLKNEFSELDFSMQQYMISHWIYQFEAEGLDRMEITNGCNVNSIILNEMTEKNLYKMDDIINENKDCAGILAISYDSQYIATTLAQFFAVYGYPLDDIYKRNGDEYSLNRENNLDFGLLDLSHIKPDVCIYEEKKLELSKIELNSELKNNIEIKNNYEKELNNLNNVLKSLESNPGDLNRLKAKDKIAQNLSRVEQRLLMCNKRIIELSCYNQAVEIDYDYNRDYHYNKTIIEGIRNSMAHGNIHIDKFTAQGEITDVDVHFQNIHEGQLYFDIKIKLRDFETLFNDHNVKVISDYIINQLNKEKTKRL